ncbi:probable pectinesterase/pectinesterase inhibitor 35 [Malania oleifera]|uniref:probable pectinesterase/pectinesterase inhibitor 35 n=1 Tax=Malania oleifera TaxID=397392 RepID=UPI0025ADBEF2|nr:probable pectinesterase/pectinesterase inhibitor 35 [Malania oleifera]
MSQGPIFCYHGNQPRNKYGSQPRNKYILQRFSLSIIIIIITLLTPTASCTNTSQTTLCSNTPYQHACQMALLSSPHQVNPPDLFRLSVQFSRHQVLSLARTLSHNLTLSHQPKSRAGAVGHVGNCVDLLDDSLDQLDSVLKAKNANDDTHTWLSAALTNQETCLEILHNFNFPGAGRRGVSVSAEAQNLVHSVRNSLALYVSGGKKKTVKGGSGGGGGRRLLYDGFPQWVGAAERRLMEASAEEIAPDAVVAADGSGSYRSLAEALAAVAAVGGERKKIYMKAGTYRENIKVSKGQTNVLLYGDGKGKTVIVGDKSSSGGSSTFDSATFAVTGDGFMAQDITFMNSAGPGKGQAVALVVASDKSVFFRCSIVGYQDTLYTYSKRQFYRDSDIYGTVDFICGNSAAIFQNCNIYSRKSGGDNFVTAQSRTDPNQNTGFSIHNCRITAESGAGHGSARTYLGRPWMEYSRTVVMQSYLDDVVPAEGWARWNGNFALGTLYYGEYMNSGPGASTGGRVKWAGYHAALAPSEAQKFTVANFISGNLWLPSTGVSFDPGLLP